MKRFAVVTVLAMLVTPIVLLAQAPKGWKMRVDRSMAASDPDAPGDIKFSRFSRVSAGCPPRLYLCPLPPPFWWGIAASAIWRRDGKGR